MKCRIFSAFISDLDQTPEPAPFKDMAPFGEPMAEFGNSKGWVEAVAWSPKGARLAFAGKVVGGKPIVNNLCDLGHDSSLHFVHFGQPGASPTIQVRINCVLFL